MSARILIVDDTPVNIKLLEAKLAREYYAISTAIDGLSALEKATAEKPDLILLDVMMPGMDGFEVCRRLKENPATETIPVVMVTALSDAENRVRGLEAGADDFLTKPIDALALMARIRSLLRLKALRDEWGAREVTLQQFSPPGSLAAANPVSLEAARILILDDDVLEGAEIQRTLAAPPLSAFLRQVPTLAEAEKALSSESWDLVFVTLDLKDEEGLVACARLRANQAARTIPLLLLADAGESERLAKGLDLGANDYLVRPLDPHEVFARARAQLRHKRNYDRLRSGLEHHLLLALVDPLTSAFNRRYLDAHLPRFWDRARENKKPLSVQILDIDHFKKINDTYGHAAGDIVLRELARRISTSLRPTDFFVRLGGEEFAVVMPDTHLIDAARVAQRLRAAIAKTPFVLPEVPEGIPVTLSIGLAETFPAAEQETSEKLFDRADAALYRAKQEGRNRIVSGDESSVGSSEPDV